MYWRKFVERGRPPERARNLHDLLRLTLAAVEIASTRREALEAVVSTSGAELPNALGDYRHSVYETSVIYEFAQLAREDFARHGNSPVWERPLAWLPDGAKYWRSVHIDMALFSAARDVETRIEFGKAAIRSQARPSPRDVKLEEDALKLYEATRARKARKPDPDDPGMKSVENLVVTWDERDSRRGNPRGKLTASRGLEWLESCKQYAGAATGKVGCAVALEGVAASTLMTFEPDVHRSVVAAIYSVDL